MSTTNENSTDSTDDEYNPDYWCVVKDGMRLEKVGYSDYELSSGVFTITFDDIRDTDDPNVFELRDGYDTLGTFDPTLDIVPDRIAVAFDILQHEI